LNDETKKTLASALEIATQALKICNLIEINHMEMPYKIVDGVYSIDRKLFNLINNATPDFNSIIASIKSTAQTAEAAASTSEKIKTEAQKVKDEPINKELQINDDTKTKRYSSELKRLGTQINSEAEKYIKALTEFEGCAAKL
jgi:hypothetical protein